MLWIIHPDPIISKALQVTLQAVWPDLPCEIPASEALSMAVPAGVITLELTTPPQRLSTLIGTIQRQLTTPARLDFGTSSLNLRSREWQQPGKDAFILTEKEVNLLLYLSGRTEAATREDLLHDVWEYAADADTHTIETHIYRLRQKIEQDPANPQILITTKDGYQLAANSSA